MTSVKKIAQPLKVAEDRRSNSWQSHSEPFTKKVKFNHHRNLSEDGVLMCLLTGKTGCGKTRLLFKILTEEDFLDFNNLIIFTTTPNQPVYQFLKYGFENSLTKCAIRKLLKIYEEDEEENNIEELCKEATKHSELLSVSKDKASGPGSTKVDQKVEVLLTDQNPPNPSKLPKDKKHCVVFDDCVNNKDQTIQKEYFIRGRHNNCSCFYLSQSFYDLNGRMIRQNANLFILFKLNKRMVSELLKEFTIDTLLFKDYCDEAWNKKFGYVVYNNDSEVLMTNENFFPK